METLLSQTQCHLEEVERMLSDKTEQLEQEVTTRQQENEEWEQVNSDLSWSFSSFRSFVVKLRTPSYVKAFSDDI